MTASKTTFEWQGLDKLRRALGEAGDLADRALEAGVYEVGEEIMAESMPLAPVDLGTLRGSGVVLEPKGRGGNVEVTIGYGGAASEYAIVQHENMEYHHETGQAKFLESVVLRTLPNYGRKLASRVERAWQRLRRHT